MPVDCGAPKLKAGAGAGASNEGIDGFAEPNVGVAPMVDAPNMGI